MVDMVICDIVDALLLARREKDFHQLADEADQRCFYNGGMVLLRHFWENNPALSQEIVNVANEVMDES